MKEVSGRKMNQRFYDMLEENPVIAAVKDEEGLEKCCGLEDIKVVFILFGDLCSIPDLVGRIKESGKMAVVHADLITGLGSREIAVDFIKKATLADGIISTKPALIKRGRELGMFTVMRYFLIDSMALENVRTLPGGVRPDVIEILPGLMPDIIRNICQDLKTPIIAGGLITDRKSVMAALSAGALCVSSTNQNVWTM